MSVEICYRNKQFTHEINENMIVKDLITEIGTKLNISEFFLKFGSFLLLEDKPVKKYLITKFTLSDNNNRNIEIEMNDLTFDLKINYSNSKDISEKAAATISVKELKTKVLSKLALAGDNWELKKNEAVMENGTLLSDCITTKVFEVSFQLFAIFLKYMDRNYAINVTKDTTVKELRKICFDKFGEAVNDFLIFFNGVSLEFEHPITFADFFLQIIGVNIISVLDQERQNKENLTLNSYGVEAGCTLSLIVRTIGGQYFLSFTIDKESKLGNFYLQ